MTSAKHGIPLLALSAAIASTAHAQITVTDDSASTLEGTAVTIDVLANDTTDFFLDTLIINSSGITQPSNGQAVYDPELEIITYTPNQGYSGTDQFTYEASDLDEYGQIISTATGTVTVVVEASGSTDTENLDDLVTGENNKEVARTITNICTEGSLSTELDNNLCTISAEDAADKVEQITPDETLLLRRINNQTARTNATRLFQHQRSLRNKDSQQAIAFDGSTLSLKHYYGGSAGDDLPAKASIFATMHGEKADYDSTDKETGHSYDSYGLTLGGDYRLRPDLFVGGAFGIIEQDLDYDRNAGGLESDLTTVTGYLSYFYKAINIDVQLTFGQGDYDIVRNLDLFGTEAIGKTEGDQIALSTQGDWSFNNGSWNFTPFIRLDYFKIEVDGYQESAGGGLALNVSDQEQDQINSNLGIDIKYTQGYSWGVLSPRFSLTAISESSGNYDPVSFSFVDDGSGTTFELRPDSEDSLYYEYQIGAVAILQGGVSCFANFTETVSLEDMRLYNISLGIRSEL